MKFYHEQNVKANHKLNVFAAHVTDKRIISRIYKEHHWINKEKTSCTIGNGYMS